MLEFSGDALGAVTAVARRYPAGLQSREEADLRRHAWHVETATSLPGKKVADFGGGLSVFSPALASLGYQATVIDDFRGEANRLFDDEVLPIFKEFGVEVSSRDIVEEGLGLETESHDIICSFDTLEHLHHSPKTMLQGAARALKPGGWFFLGVPNCVHLRKRLTVPLGRDRWSLMADWYDKPVFRGHVREVHIDDLRYIASDMGLTNKRILGRNWGYKSRRGWVRALTPIMDKPLQRFPSLCGSLYLIAQKPE